MPSARCPNHYTIDSLSFRSSCPQFGVPDALYPLCCLLPNPLHISSLARVRYLQNSSKDLTLCLISDPGTHSAACRVPAIRHSVVCMCVFVCVCVCVSNPLDADPPHVTLSLDLNMFYISKEACLFLMSLVCLFVWVFFSFLFQTYYTSLPCLVFSDPTTRSSACPACRLGRTRPPTTTPITPSSARPATA